MDAIECIMTRASEREFTGEKVIEDDLLKILKAAMAAPSARNTQPWKFIVLHDKKTLFTLTEKLPFCKMLKSAGTGIVVCGVSDQDETSRKHWMHDCSIASGNILLTAHALGYGAVYTAVHPDINRLKIVRETLNIPQNIVPLCVIPIGVPAQKSPPRDKFKKENIHYEKW